MTGAYGHSGDVNAIVATIKAQAGLWDTILKQVHAEAGPNVVVESAEQQVVAGMNYRLTVANNTTSKKHRVVVYKPLPHTQQPMTITSVEAL